jgi:hypothetical protein
MQEFQLINILCIHKEKLCQSIEIRLLTLKNGLV